MSLRQAHAFWVTAPGAGEIRSYPLAPPAAGEALVRTRYSGISRGSETIVFQGRVPVSQYQAMRAPFQEGTFPAPVKYGYCNVGVVEDGPEDLRGQTVFCLYPHQSAYVAPVAALLPVLEPVPAGRAVLAANMETAINGLWDAAPRLGDRVTVIGAGTVGCLVAYLAARIPGCQVQLLDIDPNKISIADALGVAFATPDQGQEDADLVIHASGAPAGLVRGLDLAGSEATIVEMSWYGDTQVSLPLGEAFHSKRLDLRSSQVSRIALPQRPRWSHQRRMQLALTLLADPVLDVLISGESPFAELPQTMATLATAARGVLCHRIVYEPGE